VCSVYFVLKSWTEGKGSCSSRTDGHLQISANGDFGWVTKIISVSKLPQIGDFQPNISIFGRNVSNSKKIYSTGAKIE